MKLTHAQAVEIASILAEALRRKETAPASTPGRSAALSDSSSGPCMVTMPRSHGGS
jgi:hypothetical protein